ncbi:hypothetical protein B0H14DRAFT_3642886 [Mycena olivaceomarginata]|nr:hypothetical protein B0H14DRAFT_3642886 [Mycena olivaceomarginata]
MIKHLSSFSPTFLLQACLILVTICPLLCIHTLKKVTRSFAHAPGAPDYQFHVAERSDSTLSYGGGDPDLKFQCLLGHVKHLRRRQFALSQNTATSVPGLISNAASAISMESNSTRLSSVHLSSTTAFLHLTWVLQQDKHCISYHKTLDFQKLCKTHAYSVQVDQGEWTTCKVCIPAAKLVPIVFLISICAGPLTRSVCTEPYIHLRALYSILTVPGFTPRH